MVEPRRNSSFSFSESCHQFFKIYLPEQCSHRLKIPPEFIKYFNGDLPYESTITSPAKRSWQVDVNEINGNLFFCNDWQQFVQDNSLEFGDFLIFYYGGNANFYVKIYGKNGCRKEVADDPPRRNLTTLSILQDNQTVEQSKSKQQECEASTSEEGISETTLLPRVPVAIQGDDRALEAASKFTSKFPFFKVVMTDAYVNSSRTMHIPYYFQKRYIEKSRPSVTLLVSDQSWPVKLIKRRRTCKLSAGWKVFSVENALKIGDVCVFELMERNDFVMKATIFRCPD